MARMGLQDWVEHIRDREMPVFGQTVDQVKNVTADENASIGMLSRVILQDASLTARVLKVANSAIFNPGQHSISTVSRAVTVLGFDLLADIVLSIYLIDTFLKGGLRGRVASEMARSFHAAVQARAAAGALGLIQVEEVFIAALLGRVGEMAFWCFGGDAAVTLDESMLEQPDEKPEDLQMDLLGFRLRNLTASLAREWRLGPAVLAGVEMTAHQGPAEKAIAMGYRIAAAAEYGWTSSVAQKALTAYADLLQKPLNEVTEMVVSNAAEAARVAAQFGASEAARLIPVPKSQAVDIVAEAEIPAADPMLQLRILRDLAMMLSGKPSLNEVLNLVLEGIYRGLGMQRAVFALLSADRKTLQGKAALGRESETLVRRFVFPLTGTRGDIINELFVRNQAYWIRDPLPTGINIARLEQATAQREALLAPIAAHGKVIGMFYADRGAQSPNEEAWQGFQHFVQQASLSFEHVASAGRK